MAASSSPSPPNSDSSTGVGRSSSSSSKVPAAVFRAFFESATKELNGLEYSSNSSSSSNKNNSATNDDDVEDNIDPHRQQLLNVQREALERAIRNRNHDDEKEETGANLLPIALQELNDMEESHPEFGEPLATMTLAARKALARLVLQQALEQHRDASSSSSPSLLLSSWNSLSISRGPAKNPKLTEASVYEFCGLCQAVCWLEPVQQFLVARPPLRLYDHEVPQRLPFPHERLEFIQRLYWKSLGYSDPTVATKELHQMISSLSCCSYYNATATAATTTTATHTPTHDIVKVFEETLSQLRTVVAKATQQVQHDQLSDFHEGGVTRVVSTTATTTTIPTISSETLPSEQEIQMQMARQAAALEQSLLCKLLQLDEGERDNLLDRARIAQENLQHALLHECSTKAERIAHMTDAMTPQTQELLIMHKLWQGLLQRNNGQPPDMAT